MRKKLIAGNWKMNYDKKFLTHLTHYTEISKEVCDIVDLFLAVPYPYLQNLSNKIPTWISVGAQDCSQHTGGAFTGEVSADMLKKIGCKYVILGHSERRNGIYYESNEIISKKVNNVFDAGMCPVLCVGETKKERDSKLEYTVVEKQLNECLSGIKNVLLETKLHKIKESNNKSNRKVETLNLVIAYEPVWAIGTGINAENSDIEKMISFIKETCAKLDLGPRVIYGGSVNMKNIKELSQIEICDGFLVGKASLSDEFYHIIQETCKMKSKVIF